MTKGRRGTGRQQTAGSQQSAEAKSQRAEMCPQEAAPWRGNHWGMNGDGGFNWLGCCFHGAVSLLLAALLVAAEHADKRRTSTG
ncbi:hypothetical protein MJ923_06295 [Shewanella sp. 3B26]|uniref:Uncharacterized protein n=1 Tax=Shewanella zhuhaiensis TaxID=2919576 RepID=A0AAJ1EXF0_9GAMM|nr:hypothetical protein [Shewanella zhuhaiensis]MCH4293914.1 hypothetical protein [Shewanella zhuhaiensis]